MTRCTLGLLVTLALGLLVAPLAAEAQPPAKVPWIGVLSTGSPPATAAFFAPFIQGLRDLGYVEGQHIAFEYRYAEGNLDRLPDLAAELVRLPVDLLVAGSGSSALVASLARPGGNITGVSFDTGPEIVGKRLELLKEAVPTVSRVAMLVGQVRSPTADADEKAQERAARALGLTLQYFYVLRPEAFTEWVFPAITADTPAIDALYVGGPVAVGRSQQIADFALQHRLPMIGIGRPLAEAGSLLSYGPTQRAMQQRAAVLVGKILQGAKPADLPVEQPTTFELVINLKTAKALGLTIPPTLLFQADEVIR